MARSFTGKQGRGGPGSHLLGSLHEAEQSVGARTPGAVAAATDLFETLGMSRSELLGSIGFPIGCAGPNPI